MNILRFMVGRLLETAGGDAAAAGGGGGGDGGAGGGQTPQSAAVEQRALEMGWAPKDQWRGNPDSWIDAQTFVQRGEQMLPILQANSRKDRAELAALRRQLQDQGVQLQSANESIQILTNISTEQGRATAKEKRRELLRQQAAARAEGNTDLEIDLGEQIADVTAEINAKPVQGQGQGQGNGQQGNRGNGQGQRQQPTQQQQQPRGEDPTSDPAYQAFVSENSWFGVDRRKTALATAVAQDLRADRANDSLQGKAFFDRVAAEVGKIFAPQRATGTKVEGAGGGGGGNGNNSATNDPASGKSYADLPQDAKAACDRDAKRLVGEGKTFKTEADWRKHYVTMYFNS